LKDRIFTLSEEFFGMQLADKLAASWPIRLEGYGGIGQEYSECPHVPDLNESFTVWIRNTRNNPIASGTAANLHSAMTLALPHYKILADLLLESIVNQLPPFALSIQCGDISYLQLNHAEPAMHERAILQDPHEDGHLLTLACSTAPGLEIYVDGEFRRPSIGRTEVLVMPGSPLAVFSKGAISPLVHRVVNHRDSLTRESLMFFANPPLAIDASLSRPCDTEHMLKVREQTVVRSKSFGLPSLVDTFGLEESE
jgi:isopenicillin N synthase-like dioxygenase